MKRTKANKDDDDAEIAEGNHGDRHQQVLDPNLCCRLPRRVVEVNLMAYTPYVLRSKEDLIRAVDKYIANPSSFRHRIGLWDVSQITDF
eukprot:CAMPEP_0194058338 /NCGR_PEP_ID=MMETSP0009_2-20130614/65989_1 /TAXON_ID=210454 /ORGANISM="Grammatophora oceanica, Strain CCMP 410" /LENGTH=88 /DNA_ID=CAMNT_0038708449 /DNA_START=38 /DNA_END=301 /DNA_ORIENTATION=-